MVHHLPRCAGFIGIALVSACSSGPDAAVRGGGLKATVAPLDLQDIENAVYTVSVVNASEQTVWTETLDADQYGNGQGDIVYVGPCDASDGANPNVVTVTLDALFDETGEPLPDDAWKKPPALVKEVTCLPNADVLVEFNITVLRSAEQGFFDIAVNFEDIFCSAKMDCQDALLHRPGPGGQRDLTAVVAFACTAGSNAAGAEETHLYWGDAAIVCRVGDTAVQTYPVQTHLAPGNNGPIASTTGAPVVGVYQSATYRGVENFEGIDKCYSNFALGLDTDILGANCTFEATATASAGRFTEPEFQTPANTVYPLIRWSVPLTRNGAMVCVPNAINEPGSFVQTEYSAFTGASLSVGMACGGEPFMQAADGIMCTGTSASEPDVSFIQQPDGRVMVSHNGQTYGPFALPAGTSLEVGSAECCVDPCCEETP